MKYVVVLGDGMADYGCPELGGKTPLQYARTPNMDRLASRGTVGLVKTVPDGFPPGSDVANLSVMGYDPRRYYTGRSPLEAISMGVPMGDEDVAFRCNLVTLSDEEPFSEKVMIDYSAGEISTDEARELVEALDRALGGGRGGLSFYPGVSYRHLLLWEGGLDGHELTPPHDISNRVIGPYLPRGPGAETLLRLMVESNHLLKLHPTNRRRGAAGLKQANSIWLWGEGRRPSLPGFYERFGLRGVVVAAVDLIKGIGICAGMNAVDVPGATGTITTNFRGKAEAALEELRRGADFAFVHVEAPDEAGHHGDIEAKVRAIEEIDEKVVGELMRGLGEFKDYRILVLPDHPTPVSVRTHTAEPVPFVVMDSREAAGGGANSFNEEAAARSGFRIEDGHRLMEYFVGS